MKNAKRFICAMLCLVLALSVMPLAAMADEAQPAAQKVVYAYCTLDGAVVGDANQVSVDADATTLGANQFVIPAGYHALAESAAITANDDAYLPIAKDEADETIMFTIVVMEMDTNVVVKENAGRIAANAGTVSVADVAKQYKDRPVISVVEDAENGVVYAYVAPIKENDDTSVTDKIVYVSFKMGDKVIGDTVQVKVAYDATEVLASAVTAPAGYHIVGDFADITKDDTAFFHVMVNDEEPENNDGDTSVTDKIVYVTFVCGEETVGSTQLVVDINATDFVMNKVNAPEGYTLVNPDHKAPIDAENNAVVAVKADELEGGSSITKKIVYVYFVCGEETVGEAQVEVAIDQVKLPMNNLVAPDGYVLVNPDHFANIDNEDNAYVAVNAIEKEEKEVLVHFIAPGDKEVGTTTVTLPTDQYALPMANLIAPKGYHLVNPGHNAVVDGENNAYVAVESNGTDGNVDNVPKTGDETAVVMMTTLCVISMAAAATLVSLKKKSENR